MPIYTGNASGNPIAGSAEADTLIGFGGADTLNGGEGGDIIYGYAPGADGGIVSTLLLSGLSQPVGAATAPGDDGFLYVCEKATGVIWRIDEASGARSVFLDIPNTEFTSDGERGLLGLAFHPEYETNGRFFVFVTDSQGDLQVREYARSADPSVADAGYSVVIDIPHRDYTNHNGGWIAFSPIDGFLYIATGDGGGGGDPQNNAQNLESLLGKMLRIDVDGDDFPADPDRNYAIPADNPFVGVAGADEIWAYGLRNPWRNAFDPRNGDLYIADVGQTTLEEINYLAIGSGGANLGWRIMEGDVIYNPAPPPAPQPGDSSLIGPIFTYGRTVGRSITGGEVYVGTNSGFVGQYVFADFITGRLFSLSVDDGEAVDAVERGDEIIGQAPTNVVDFVTGADGVLYAIGIGGSIWRLTPLEGAEDVGDVLNGGGGGDQIFGGAGADLLSGDAGDDTLNGGLGADTLWGRADSDSLDGAAGADAMYGGAGDDTYYVDAAGDVVVEAAGAGVDTVYSSITRSLGPAIEHLVLTGALALNGVGNVLANALTGNGAANILNGANGADTLSGEGGADTLNGGNGADTIFGGAGADLIDGGNENDQASAGADADRLFGRGGDDVMSGDLGADTIYGGDGADTLDGGEGDDLVDGGNGDDVAAGGAGSDILYGRQNDDTIQGDAGADTLYGGDGEDGLEGGGDNDLLDGGNGHDDLRGGDGDDTLYGRSGADTLDGGAGADTLIGGNDADTFVFSSPSGLGNVDAIVGFSVAEDTINLDITAFAGINAGVLAASAFTIGTAATDAEHRIIYDSATGRLYYDADGDGAGAAILFATLSPGLPLTNADFFGVGGP